MADVLDEVTAESVTRDEVQRRIDDWAKRIDDLYHSIESWLPPGHWAERARRTTMDEELMREVGIPSVALPLLDIVRNGRRLATIEPRGLWIVGVNGRLDLTRVDQHYLLVDLAQNFDPPDWRISPLTDRRQLDKLDEEGLLRVVGA